jgi:hypothetical protein
MRGPGLLSRRAGALAFVAACGAVVALCLGGQSASVVVRAPLVERPARGPIVVAPLPAVGAITLTAADPVELVAHDELWLFPVPGPAGARLRRAELRAAGSSCRFEAAGVHLIDGEPLVLRRRGGCSGGVPPPALELVVEVEGGRRVGLQAHRPREGSAERGRVLVEAPDGTGPLSVRGFRVDHPPTAPRVVLLSAMWRRAGSTTWLWALVGLAVALALAGVLLFPTDPAPEGGATSRFGRRCALGAGLLSASLAVAYAVLTPPLCAPDEPYHLMGFGELVGNRRVVDETYAWMRETHQMRIRHRPQERFRTVDVAVPETAEDPEARPTEAERRSATGVAYWRALAPLLRRAGAVHALLGLRLANAALFALAVGAAAALLASCAQARSPQWIAFPFFFVPTLPFFAMHVSETAVLCSLYVLLAASLAVLFLDGTKAHRVGLPLGLACGLMLAAGRSPWPLGAVVAAALAARVTLGPGGSVRRVRPALVFWAGLAAGVASFRFVLNPAYQQMILDWTQFVPEWLRPTAGPGAFVPLAVVGVAVAAVLEVALGWVRPALGRVLDRPATSLARWAALGLAGLVVLSLVASLFMPLPQIALEPPRPLTLEERLRDVLGTTATLFRLREANFLLGTSFWLGFGWLDAIPDGLMEPLLVLLTAAATLALLLQLARRPDSRRMTWLALLGAGGFVTMALYTIVTQSLPMALHGRYLIGWYLVFLTIAACGLAGVDREGKGGPPPWLPGALLVVAGSIHAYCLCFILRRYF